MAVNSKLSIAVSLFLWLGSSIAAHAYSYDEIVQMVRAEEKVFGQADYGKSLDQRLEALEMRVFGVQKTGSDSVRLTRISRALGLSKDEIVTSPAPIAVQVAAKQNTQNDANNSTKQCKKIFTIAALGAENKQPVCSNNSLLTSTKSISKSAKVKAKKSERKPLAHPLAPVFATHAPSMQAASLAAAAPSNESVQAADNKPASSLGAFLIAIVVGIVAISFGMVTYLLLKVKNEVVQPFGNEYDFNSAEALHEEQDEEANSQTNWNNLQERASAALEQSAAGSILGTTARQQVLETATYIPQISDHSSNSHTAAKKSELENSSVSVSYQWASPPASTDSFENTWGEFETTNNFNSEFQFLPQQEFLAPSEFAAPMVPQEMEQMNESKEQFANDSVQEQEPAVTFDEMEQPSMSECSAQVHAELEVKEVNPGPVHSAELRDTQHVNEFIQEWQISAADQRFFESDFVTEASLPAIPVQTIISQDQTTETARATNNSEFSFLLQTMSQEQLNNILKAYASELESETDPVEDFAYLCEMDSSEPFPEYPQETFSLAAEQEAETELAPEISQLEFNVPVAPKFLTVSNWKDKEDQANAKPIKTEDNSAQLDINCESTIPNISLQLEKINLENLIEQTFSLPDEEEEKFRALASMLIDAAKQAKTPMQYAREKRVPLYSKRGMAHRIAMGADLEDKLRQLFSEKV